MQNHSSSLSVLTSELFVVIVCDARCGIVFVGFVRYDSAALDICQGAGPPPLCVGPAPSGDGEVCPFAAACIDQLLGRNRSNIPIRREGGLAEPPPPSLSLHLGFSVLAGSPHWRVSSDCRRSAACKSLHGWTEGRARY